MATLPAVQTKGIRRLFTKQPAGFDIPGQSAGWRGGFGRGMRQAGAFGPSAIRNLLGTYGGTEESDIWVYACVSLIAAELASYPWEVEQPGADASDVLLEDDIPPDLKQLLDMPNNRMTYFDYAEYVAMDLELAGNSFWLKDNMTRDGRPARLMRLRPDLVEIATNRQDEVIGYAYQVGDIKVPYDLKEVMHFKYPSPTDSDKYGMGTVEAIQRSIGADIEEFNHITAFFSGGGRLSGIITTNETLSEESWSRLKEDFEQQFLATTNKLGLLIAEQGTNYVPINVAPAGSGVIELRQMNKDEILSGFGVPEFLLGGSGQGGVYRMSEAQFIFGRNMQPKAKRYQERMEQDLVLPGWSLNFTVDPTYAEPPDTKIERAAAMLGKGASLNQMLVVQDLPPIDDPTADEPMLQVGILPWSIAIKTANAQANSAEAAAQMAAGQGGGGFYSGLNNGADSNTLDSGFYNGLGNGATSSTTGADMSTYTGSDNTGDLSGFDSTSQYGRGSGSGVGGSNSFFAGLSAEPEVPMLQAPRPRSRHRDAPKRRRMEQGYKSVDQTPIEFPPGFEQWTDAKAKEASQEHADAAIRAQAKVLRDNVEKARGAMHDFFIEQRKRIVGKLTNKSIAADVLMEIPGHRRVGKKEINFERLWNENVEDSALLNAYLPLVDDIAQQALDADAQIVGSGIDWSLTNPLIKSFRNTLAQRVTRINETTRERLKEVIEEGMKRGFSIPQIANGVERGRPGGEDYPGIQGVFDHATAARAETIARTETATIYNLAAVAGYKDAGVERVEVMDGTHDPVCAEANGSVWTLEHASENPLGHPNCRRTFVPLVGKHVRVREFKGVGVTMGEDVDRITHTVIRFEQTETFIRARKSVVYGDDFTYGDRLMADLAHEFGFDGEPHMVTEPALNVYVSQGEREVFLAFASLEHADETMTGHPVYELGVTGNGVHASKSQRRAREMSGQQGVVLRATLKAYATIADLAVVEAQTREEEKQLWPQVEKGDEVARALYTVSRNAGRWAMAKGADAMYDDRLDQFSIFNLTALRIQRGPLPPA